MSSPAAAAVAPSSPKASPASPKASPQKRKDAPEADADAPQASSAKKAKGTAPDANAYALNFNRALDKEHENKSFAEIIKLPPSALQGLGDRADAMLKEFGIKTIEDLGRWKFFLIARSIVKLAEVEDKNKRPADSKANINGALDKEHEKKSFTQIAKENVSALQGLAPWSDSVLKPLGAGKIYQLGAWRYCLWAEAFTQLAAFENANFSS